MRGAFRAPAAATHRPRQKAAETTQISTVRNRPPALPVTATCWEVIAGSGYVSDYASYRDNVLFYASYMTADDFFWLPKTEDGTFILEYTIKPENQNDGLLQTELLSVSGDGVTQSPITLTH